MMRNDADGDNGRITICLGADRRFAFPLAVTLSSIRATHPGDLCRVFVVADGFDEQSRATVSEAAGGLDLQWFDMKDVGLNCVRLPWPDVVSKATCFRLLLPDLLPLGTERVIYLDCDTIVCGSLQELWATPFAEGQLVAAVHDAYAPWAGAPGGTAWRDLNLLPSTPYFNAGVMVIPVQRWRRENIGPRAVSLMNERELIYMDQCALNALIRGAWYALEPKWNLQSPHVNGWHFGWVLSGEAAMQEALESPIIVHYSSGDAKPWRTAKHGLSHKWYEALDRTAWKGWRPTPAEGQSGIILPRI
jgi:lipopolysaccharide biosynthesis glycosyltransferase